MAKPGRPKTAKEYILHYLSIHKRRFFHYSSLNTATHKRNTYLDLTNALIRLNYNSDDNDIEITFTIPWKMGILHHNVLSIGGIYLRIKLNPRIKFRNRFICDMWFRWKFRTCFIKLHHINRCTQDWICLMS